MAAPSVAWLEVTGKDGPALQSFYGQLFDWKVQDAGDGSGYGRGVRFPRALATAQPCGVSPYG